MWKMVHCAFRYIFLLVDISSSTIFQLVVLTSK